MYLNILKRDLRRNKSMNVILFIFIIMAVAFITSSCSSFLSITSSIDSSIEKAGIADFMMLSFDEEDIENNLMGVIEGNEGITSYNRDKCMFATTDNILLENGKPIDIDNILYISAFPLKTQNIFNQQNEIITTIDEDEIYLPKKMIGETGVKLGDTITIKVGELEKHLKVKLAVKDIFLGEPMMGLNRVMISETNYNEIMGLEILDGGNVTFINMSNEEQFKSDLSAENIPLVFSISKSQLPMAYMMDAIITGVFLIVSICLILISILILRFTILFTLSEEFREIGIMKAIGITEAKIRGLYIVKYLAISVVSAIIGFFIGIPFTNLFLSMTSSNIILTASQNAMFIQAATAILVVLIVMLFCYSCTKRINKYTPIDAIRSGSTGERYRKKGFFRLTTSKISPVWFMAINDITSNFKRFAILMFTFVVSVLLLIIPMNAVNTLDSDGIVIQFGMRESDLVLRDPVSSQRMLSCDKEEIEEHALEIKQKLADNSIEAEVFMECLFIADISYKDKSVSINTAQQGIFTKADEYAAYIDGIAPKLENEIALSHVVAKELDVAIGDTITVRMNKNSRTFLVTGLIECMNNLGMAVRFSENTDLPYGEVMLLGVFPIQIKYTDNPTNSEKIERQELIQDLFPKSEVMKPNAFVDDMIGGISGQIRNVRTLILFIVCAVNILVVVLLSRSFITKEVGEIAMLKGIGFSDGAIMRWQVIRIGLIMLVSTIIAILISTPLSHVTIGKVFEMMGSNKIKFEIKPLEVYVIYPVIIFIVNIIAGALSAFSIKKVLVQETNNIE